MILAAILWGLGNVAQQTVLEHVGPFTAVTLRCLIAVVTLLLMLGFRTQCLAIKARRPALYSALSFAAAVTLSQLGYGQTTVTNAGFFINTTTVITPILAWIFLMQRPHMIVWLAAVLILVGAIFMSGGSLQGLKLGDLLCLASAVCYSFWMIFLAAFARQSGDAARMALVQFTITALICLPLALAFEQVSPTSLVSAIPELLFLGLFSTAGAYYLQIVALKHTSASEAAVIGSGEAVIGAVAAYLLLGEIMTGTSAMGAGLILAGIVMVQLPALVSDALRHRTSSKPLREHKIDLLYPIEPRPSSHAQGTQAVQLQQAPAHAVKQRVQRRME
jgi:drug/metabolite transporter (DMT)-like permease